MYGIRLSRSNGQQTISFGLRGPLPFENLADAYRLVVGDLSTSRLKISYAPDPAWGELLLGEGADLELMLNLGVKEHILRVSDIESGDSTSTGVDSLEAAFDFMAYWAGESLRRPGEEDA